MDKFQNKYRIPSARMQSWDYGANAAYFITICTHYRQHFFGDIIGNIETKSDTSKAGVSTMQLNRLGQIAEKCWLEIPKHYPFIELGNFVVMPDHIHGILIVDKKEEETPKLGVSTPKLDTTTKLDITTTKLDITTTKLDSNTTKLGITTTKQDITTTKLDITTTKLDITTTKLDINTTKLDTFTMDLDDFHKHKTGGKNPRWKPNSMGSIINQYKRIVTITARHINPDFAWQSRFHDHIIRNVQAFENIQNYISNNPMNWKGDILYDPDI
ncbi:MAG: hypothetical protein ABIV51_04335 [Saprospiraceae bacterium]